MDIEMDFECRECGWRFTRSFLQLEHGRAVKCPFCSGSSLLVRGESTVAEECREGAIELAPGSRVFLESKIKL